MKRIGAVLIAGISIALGNGCGSQPAEPAGTDAASVVSPAGQVSACSESLRRDLQGKARPKLQDQPSPDMYAFVTCQTNSARARLLYRRDPGGGQSLFFLVYFEREADGWEFRFDDVVMMPSLREDGRPAGMTDVLKTRNETYWFAGEHDSR